jgi:hypothetical protein
MLGIKLTNTPNLMKLRVSNQKKWCGNAYKLEFLFLKVASRCLCSAKGMAVDPDFSSGANVQPDPKFLRRDSPKLKF